MRRRLFTTVSAISLAFFVVVVAIWVRSCFVGDWFWHRPAGGDALRQAERSVYSAGGAFVFLTNEFTFATPEAAQGWRGRAPLGRGYDRTPAGDTWAGSWLGFKVLDDEGTGRGGGVLIRMKLVQVPYWPVAALAAVLPALWLRGRYRAYRRAHPPRPFVPAIRKGQRPSVAFDAVVLGMAGLVAWMATRSAVFFASYSVGWMGRRTTELLMLYLPVGAAVVVPLLLAYYVRRPHAPLRRAFGLCAACGYDLSGNQSGVCPECGAAVGGMTQGGEEAGRPVSQ